MCLTSRVLLISLAIRALKKEKNISKINYFLVGVSKNLLNPKMIRMPTLHNKILILKTKYQQFD